MPDADAAAAPRARSVGVTGATGYIGSLVCRRLRAAGMAPVALGRSAPPDLPWRRFELDRPPGPELLEGLDSLVHCAWDLSLVRPGRAWAANVIGTERLFDLARRSGVARIVFVSSMSAYPGTRQLYGLTKLAGEQAAFDNGGAVVRLGLVLGPEWGGMGGTLKRLVSLPVTPLVARSSYQFTVHEEDVAEAVLRVIEAPAAPAVPLGIAHPDPVPVPTLLEQIALAVGTTPRFVALDWRIVYAAVRTAETFQVPLPFRSESLLGLARPAPEVPNAGLVEALGIRLRRFDGSVSPGLPTGPDAIPAEPARSGRLHTRRPRARSRSGS